MRPRAVLGGQAVLVVGLSAAVWLAYYPSLSHPPRADQWCILLDTVDQHQFFSLVAHTYSYSRTRMICPGDYHLFRPMLFALFSAEKALFGNHFASWQATGILLHCLVLYLLLLLLLRIHEIAGKGKASDASRRCLSPRMGTRAVSYALVIYFGLNCAVVEMVMWSHINGYILFVVFVLGSMSLLLEGIADSETLGRKRGWLLAAAWLLALLSAFTYELGQFYAVIAGMLAAAVLYQRGKARLGLVVFTAFLGILLLYRTANFLDQRAHADRLPDESLATILERIGSGSTLAHAVRYLLYEAVQPFFPCCVDWSFGPRLRIPEAEAARWLDWKGCPTLIASYVLLGGMAGLTLMGLRRLMAADHTKMGLIVALLGFSLFALHMAITVLGRMNLRPSPLMLSNNSYYTYIPFLFLLLGVSALWSLLASAPTAAWTKVRSSLCAVVFTGFVILSLVSAVKVYAINAKGREDSAGFIRQIALIERFIRHHRREADFSLAFDLESCNVIGTQYGVPITTILFQRYLNATNPKYVICFPKGEPYMTTYDEWRQSCGLRSRLCPELVSVGSYYNFYRVEGRYYGVMHWDGWFDPSRSDHAYLIKAPTLEEARLQQNAKLAEIDADILIRRFFPQDLPIDLLEEGFKGFNLIAAAGRVYAIPQEEGAFNLEELRRSGSSAKFSGPTLESVREQIRKLHR
jgi:hypothetical protein